MWPPSSQNNIICLAVDRLHAAYLGAYGNTWINTPALDRLAAESFLLDRAIIDSPRLEVTLSLAVARRACHGSGRRRRAEIVAGAIRAGRLANGFVGRRCGRRRASVGDAILRSRAAETASTAIAPLRMPRKKRKLPNSLPPPSGQLQQLKPPFFLWLHTGALGSIWDAPLEFREQYRDEDDPHRRKLVRSSQTDSCRRQFDPDQLLAVYARLCRPSNAIRSTARLAAGLNRRRRTHAQHAFGPAFAARFSAGRASPRRRLRRRPVRRTDPRAAMLRFPDGLGAADRSAGARAARRSRGDDSRLGRTQRFRDAACKCRPRPIAAAA